MVYLNVGKFEESLENLHKSLDIAIETGDKSIEMGCLCHLGIVHKNLRKYEKAQECNAKWLNCAREVDDKKAEGTAYNSIGCVYRELGNLVEAVKCFEESLRIARTVNDKEGEGDALYRLGLANSDMKMYDEAIAYFEMSLVIGIDIDNNRIIGPVNHALGMAYYERSKFFASKGEEGKRQEDMEKYEETLKAAFQCGEREFTHLKDMDDLIADMFIASYKMLTKVLVKRQKTEEALLISDLGRARSLESILVSKYGITEERAPSHTPLDSTGLENLLSSNKSSCILYFAKKNTDLHAWVLTHQKPIVLVNICNRTLNKILTLQAETGLGNVEIIIEGIKSEVLLNTFYHKKMEMRCENRSFESTKGLGFPSVKESKNQPLESAIQSVERNTVPVGEPQMNVTEQETDPLEVLFSLLVEPVIQHLQHEELVIIPHDSLFRVPFAALKDPTTDKYLSETKSIRISPSLATLKALQECAADNHSKIGALIVGDPDVGEVIFEKETKTFERLPSAKSEAESIAMILKTKPLTGSQATKEMVKKKLREGVAVIHIAAHGDSYHGHIALVPTPRTDGTSIPEEQDYMLTMEEVQEIGVTAQLVVLSCCHSGR